MGLDMYLSAKKYMSRYFDPAFAKADFYYQSSW